MDYKKFLKNYFHYLSYFYGYLRYRIFIAFGISLLVGLLDGIGLALFIPLFKLITTDSNATEIGKNQDFISDLVINQLGITPNLTNIFLLIFIFFGLKGIAKFIESFTRIIYQQYFMRKIRISNIDLLNRYDFQKFLKTDAGRIQNTFGGEVNRVNTAYIYYFKSIQFGVLVLVYVSLALGSDWKFTLLAVVGGILINFIYKVLYKRTKYFSKKLTFQSHIFQNLLVQKIHLFKYLKATGLNDLYGEKLKTNIIGIEGLQRRMGMVDALLGAIREPLTILVVFGAIFLNMYFFDEVVGSILLSLILLYRGITFFMAMQEQWNLFLGVSGSLDNMQSFTEELMRGRERNGTEIFKGFTEKLQLKDLSFEFDSGEKVLRNINLSIYKNETLAIVGESGAGKSTLLNILSGLLLPGSGSYLIDNTSIEQLDLPSFKKHIGYIVQDATIFNDTIYNNISFWAPKTAENYGRFLKAIEKAAISDYIMNLPQKEDSLLGTNGINISGGQKQRLSIARELYKEVDFLFMDEATSALDGETESVIQQNINHLKGQFTIIIIAHRLATIKNADRIILMKNGSISAIGSFEKLLETSEEFRGMVQLQNL